MSYNPFSLKGKTVLVTGASSGIGQATAIECSKLGANVIISARNENRLKDTLSQMDGEGHSIAEDKTVINDEKTLVIITYPDVKRHSMGWSDRFTSSCFQ